MEQDHELTEAEKAKQDETLGNLTSDIQELKKKSVSGFGWATAQQAVGRITTFVVQLVLAHLLTPDDFGVVAALGIFLAISYTLAEAGFSSSLTRQETLTEEDLSTVFYYNLGASIVFYLILFLIAPWVADYFRKPILCPIGCMGSRISSMPLVRCRRCCFGDVWSSRSRCSCSSSTGLPRQPQVW